MANGLRSPSKTRSPSHIPFGLKISGEVAIPKIQALGLRKPLGIGGFRAEDGLGFAAKFKIPVGAVQVATLVNEKTKKKRSLRRPIIEITFFKYFLRVIL